MAIVVPVPTDATYDYIPLDPSQVQVGMSLVSLYIVDGQVTTAWSPTQAGGTSWQFNMLTWNGDGTSIAGTAFYPGTPANQPTVWWQRWAVWKRTAKPSDGQQMTASDGSKWIYPAGEDGRMRCFVSGSTFNRGDQRFRGQLTTDPKDLWICDDPDWDWLPITDGSQVSVGDTIRASSASAGTVATADVSTTDTSWVTTFRDSGSNVLGWWAKYSAPQPVTSLNYWVFLQRLPQPAVGTKFRAPDGSRWIFLGSSQYYCWGTGTNFVPGSIFTRGDIVGWRKGNHA